MSAQRLTVVAMLLVMAACGRPAEEKPAVDEKAPLEAVIRRIPARELCAEPFTAPARRVNYQAAFARHKGTLDSIARLDWRTDEISEDQMAALNRAKFQINRAELIDLALALREDFRPPSGKRVTAAYGEHSAVIERLAAEKWETSQSGEKESKALATAGQRLLAAREMDQAELMTGNTSKHGAAALAANGAAIRGLAAKDWKTQTPTEEEDKALAVVLNAHLRDVAAAADRLVALGASNPMQEAFKAHGDVLRRLATEPWDKGVSKDEQSAVCAVLSAVAKR